MSTQGKSSELKSTEPILSFRNITTSQGSVVIGTTDSISEPLSPDWWELQLTSKSEDFLFRLFLFKA